MTPKNKLSAKKKYFTIITYYTKPIRFYLPLPISITLSIFSQCLCPPHSPNIPILFTAIPQHIIISPIHCIGYAALLKPFTVTSGEMQCHAIMIHTD